MQYDLSTKIEKSYPLLKKTGNERRALLQFRIGKKEVLPGQFFMLNYKLSQKPISVYNYDDGIVTFLVENRGKTTKAMIDVQEGKYFGITGPLGNSFKTDSFKNFLLIGGGVGVAPVISLAHKLTEEKKDFTLLLGEKTKENIIYLDDLKIFKDKVIYTDDGSFGKKGFPTEELDDLFDANTYDISCICGPEIMMKISAEKILKLNKINIQICMERYMKCGIGLCGSCVLDDIGLRVCADGTVFDYQLLKNSSEFGNYKRDKSGVIEKI